MKKVVVFHEKLAPPTGFIIRQTINRIYCQSSMQIEKSQPVGERIMPVGWLVGFGFNGPLRQYFSLYRAVSQREGERGKKG